MSDMTEQRWYAVRYRSHVSPNGVIYAYGPRHVVHVRNAIFQSGWEYLGVDPCTSEEATR